MSKMLECCKNKRIRGNLRKLSVVELIKIKRKLWIHPDYNIQFRNMINIIRVLESLPIKHYTIKNIE